ncbi:MAG: endolytic transglycosylase MltG, partial [Burkholderiaceae bacterium]
MKKLATLLFVIAIVAAGAVGWANHRYHQEPLRFDKAPVRVEIRRGDNLRQVASRLSDSGIHVSGLTMSLIGRYRPDASRIQAGTYLLSPPMTLETLVDKMVGGEVMATEVRFIEGWRFAQMRDAIRANPDIKIVASDLPESELMARLGSERKKAEGLFFPSTYKAGVGATDLDIYRQAYEKMQSVLMDAWKGREENLPLETPYDALRLASIVEKETGIEEDRDIIAGVFINRLRLNMMLQSDPT